MEYTDAQVDNLLERLKATIDEVDEDESISQGRRFNREGLAERLKTRDADGREMYEQIMHAVTTHEAQRNMNVVVVNPNTVAVRFRIPDGDDQQQVMEAMSERLNNLIDEAVQRQEEEERAQREEVFEHLTFMKKYLKEHFTSPEPDRVAEEGEPECQIQCCDGNVARIKFECDVPSQACVWSVSCTKDLI